VYFRGFAWFADFLLGDDDLVEVGVWSVLYEASSQSWSAVWALMVVLYDSLNLSLT
jgi:hypothetical protein